jgi:hypothetical protein
VVLHHQRQVAPPHRVLLGVEFAEGVRRMQFMHHMPVDVQQLAAVGPLRHVVGFPDLVEQRAGHGDSYSALGASPR